MGAPQKIVAELERVRLLEAVNRSALRIHSTEQMPNDTVLAGGVKRLQHNQQRLFRVGIEQVLQLRHALQVLADLGCRIVVRRMPARVGGVDARQANLAAGLDDEFFAIIQRSPPVAMPR